eukprot:2730558-Prymnesium_polylepis.2
MLAIGLHQHECGILEDLPGTEREPPFIRTHVKDAVGMEAASHELPEPGKYVEGGGEAHLLLLIQCRRGRKHRRRDCDAAAPHWAWALLVILLEGYWEEGRRRGGAKVSWSANTDAICTFLCLSDVPHAQATRSAS